MAQEGKGKSISGLVGFALGLVVAGVASAFFFSNVSVSQPRSPVRATDTPSSAQEQIAGLRADIQSLREQLDAISQESSSPNSNLDLAALRAEVKSLDRRLSTIEQAVLDNPSKALELTILEHDIENLKATFKSDQENTQAEIARLYDQNKWFIGLMATMALALMSLVVSNFIRKPDKMDLSRTNANDDASKQLPREAARRPAKSRSGGLRLMKKPRSTHREFVETPDDDLLN